LTDLFVSCRATALVTFGKQMERNQGCKHRHLGYRPPNEFVRVMKLCGVHPGMNQVMSALMIKEMCHWHSRCPEDQKKQIRIFEMHIERLTRSLINSMDWTASRGSESLNSRMMLARANNLFIGHR